MSEEIEHLITGIVAFIIIPGLFISLCLFLCPDWESKERKLEKINKSLVKLISVLEKEELDMPRPKEDDTLVIGKMFGKWKVLERSEKKEGNNIIYKCICECGTIKLQRKSRLILGKTIQCLRCTKSNDIIDYKSYIGKAFGNRTILHFSDHFLDEEDGECYVEVICGCGFISENKFSDIKTNTYIGCNNCRIGKTKHNLTDSKIYRTWKRVKVKECFWTNFDDFKNDMGIPNEDQFLKRLDDTHPFSKDNCKWVTKKVTQPANIN